MTDRGAERIEYRPRILGVPTDPIPLPTEAEVAEIRKKILRHGLKHEQKRMSEVIDATTFAVIGHRWGCVHCGQFGVDPGGVCPKRTPEVRLLALVERVMPIVEERAERGEDGYCHCPTGQRGKEHSATCEIETARLWRRWKGEA